MNYQGHVADGSSIQKHSAGGLYPYVLVVRDAKLGEGSYDWGVMGPDIKDVAWYGRHSHAVEMASHFKRLYDGRAARRLADRMCGAV